MDDCRTWSLSVEGETWHKVRAGVSVGKTLSRVQLGGSKLLIVLIVCVNMNEGLYRLLCTPSHRPGGLSSEGSYRACISARNSLYCQNTFQCR